jgi:hypothetical protein
MDAPASSGDRPSGRLSISANLEEHQAHLSHAASHIRTAEWVEERQKDRIGYSVENSPPSVPVALSLPSAEEVQQTLEEFSQQLGDPVPCEHCIRSSGNASDSGYQSSGCTRVKKSIQIFGNAKKVNRYFQQYPDLVNQVKDDDSYWCGAMSPTRNSSDSMTDDQLSSAHGSDLDARSELGDPNPPPDLRRIVRAVLLIRRKIRTWQSTCNHNRESHDLLSVPPQHLIVPTSRLRSQVDFPLPSTQAQLLEATGSQKGFVDFLKAASTSLDPEDDPSPSTLNPGNGDLIPPKPRLYITLPDGQESNIVEVGRDLPATKPTAQLGSPSHLSTSEYESAMAISPSSPSDYSRTVTGDDVDSEDEMSTEGDWVSVQREQTSFVAKLMRAFKAVIEEKGPSISQMIRTAAGGGQGSTSSSHYAYQSNRAEQPSSSKLRTNDKGKKRLHSTPDEDEDDQGQDDPKRPKHEKARTTATFTFLCPYYKKYPHRTHAKSCKTPKRSTARLK